MENLFLFESATPLWLSIRFLSLITVSALFIWLFNTVYMLYFYKAEKHSFTLTWKFSILKSFIAFVLFFSVYIFFLIKVNGLHWFNWLLFPLDLLNIYLLLSPEILLLIVIIAFFYYKKSQIHTLIK